MIGHFPTPYPDESLYSICARFSERVQYPSAKAILEELYGATTATAVFYLPNRLSFLASSLPSGSLITIDRLIDNFTILPFFSAFLPPERVRIIRDNMASGSGAAAYMRSGIMASCIKAPASLRFCSLCIQEDEAAYWHRSHQLPGITICHLHGISLEFSTVSMQACRNPLLFISAREAISSIRRPILLQRTRDKIILNLARDAYWLLQNPQQGINPQDLHKRYLRLLVERGLATHTGSIRATKLIKEFSSFYSPSLLKQLNCEFTGKDQNKTNWLLRLVRSPRHSHHPLYHLLLMQLLGYSAKQFFQLPVELNYFDEGPWPCLNPAADHYRENVVQQCILSSRLRDRHPIGTFKCDCGFAYTRSGPDSSPDDKYRIGRIASFGPTWEAKLIELWKDCTLSLSEISRQLGVDPMTVRRHASRLKLPCTSKGRRTKPLRSRDKLKSVDSSSNLRNRRKSYRSKWLSARKKKSKVTLKSLRKALPKIYAWLIQNDSEWLKRNSPRSRKIKKVTSSVDWKKRDIQYAALVKQSATRMRNGTSRPIRITKTAIARDLGVISLFQKHLHKMPNTRLLLSNLAESIEEFAIRRVWWAADQYQQKGLVPQQWQLIFRANVYRHRGVHKVRDAIRDAFKMLNSEVSLIRAATA